MIITPGSNVLSLAMGPIARQVLGHRRFVSRETNAAGVWESTFAPPVQIVGSLQPVNRALYAQLGLQLTKHYAHLYTSAPVRSTDRDREGDYVTFQCQTWQAESDQDWRGVDGWRKILCVRVP